MAKVPAGGNRRKRPNKPGMGARKGGAFEREVARKLSLWITGGRNPDALWRSASSGGRATQAAKKGVKLAHVSGDLCAVHADGVPFIDSVFVECKHVRDLGLRNAMVDRPSALMRFWHKAHHQAVSHGKHSTLLVAKQNGLPALALVDRVTLTSRLPHLVLNGNINVYRLDELLSGGPHAQLRARR